MSQAGPPTLEQRLTGWVAHPKWWLFVAVALLATTIKWWWAPYDDDSAYLSIAHHLSRGEWMCFGSPYLRYTVGYPMVIAPCFWLSERPFLAISLVNVLLGTIYIAGLWQWLKRIAGAASPLLLLFVIGNAGFFMFYTRTVSEILFMPALVWGAVWLQRLADRSDQPMRRWVVPLLLAVAIVGFGGWVRQTVALVVGGLWIVMALSAWRGERSWARAALVGVLTAVGVAAIVGVAAAIKVSAIEASGDPAGYFLKPNADTWAAQFFETVRLRMSEVGRVTVPFMIKTYAQPYDWVDINIVVYAAVFIAVAVGWWRAVRSTRDVLLWLVPFHVVFFLLWPFEASVRYTVPMLPVIAFCVWKLIEPMRDKRLSILFVLVVLHVIGALGWWAVNWRDYRFHRDWPAIERLASALEADPNHVRSCGFARRNIMLGVALNRSVPNYDDLADVADYTGMVVLTDDDDPPPGFKRLAYEPALRAGVYRHESSPIPDNPSAGVLRPGSSKPRRP